MDTPFTLTHTAQSSKKALPLPHMQKLKMQIGKVLEVAFMPKARNPSYEMQVHFSHDEIKTSCGQLVDNYTVQELHEQQILAITNFAPKRIAGIKSQALTLGFSDKPQSRQAIYLTPGEPVPDGTCINFASEGAWEPEADFAYFLALDIRSATIKNIQTVGGYTLAHTDLGEMGESIAWIPGDLQQVKNYIGEQVAVWMNPMPSVQGLPFQSILLVAPLEKYDHTITENYLASKEVHVPVTLVKVSKPVDNGLALF
ncbi:MAG: hypothetical protein AAF335_03025 [Bacteroidota bacterium]